MVNIRFMTNLHLLEPILLKNLDSMDITQLLLTFFVSSEIPQTSGEFQVALAFNISNKMPNARLEYLVKCYKLLTPINKKTGYQMISTPRKISAQATLLLKTALRESLPALTVSLKSKSVLRIDQLETILSYFEANKEETPSQPLLELLSLQLTKQDTFTNNEDFLRVYQLFSELDLKSLAMADHFNKTFYHLVQSDIEKSVLALRLEGKVQPDAPTEDSTLATYQRRAEDFALEYAFKRVLNYSWSFFKFSYRSGEMKYIDKSLLESMIKAVNMSVK